MSARVLSTQSDVVVIGAGLIGAALALDLSHHTQHRVTLLERRPPIGPPEQANLRVVALGQAAVDVLTRVGVFQALTASHCHAYDSMRIWDENSTGQLTFVASEFGLNELGYMVDANQAVFLLQQAALQRAEQTDKFKVEFDSELTTLSVGSDAVSLITATDDYSTRLVIGADGAHSWVRQQCGILSQSHDYRQLGIVCRIKTSKSHQNCAWQRFLNTGPIAILPVAENQSSIVWSAEQLAAQALLELDDTAFGESLEQALEGRLGKVIEVTPRVVFALNSHRAGSYGTRRSLLVGDAAHGIHPLAGQGANLGFKDAQAVAQILSTMKSEQVGDLNVLARYETQRKLDNEQTDSMMTLFDGVYRHHSPWLAQWRGYGMNLLDRSYGLKRFLAKQAIGG